MPAVLLCGLVYGDAGRQEAVLDRNYKGSYPDLFTGQFDRVRLLVHQAQLEASMRLGFFQYQQGFQYPLIVRFDDSAPIGIEHALAYVRMGQNSTGQFMQEMVVNLAEMSRNSNDFDQVFTHEMTHAVLNDACGGRTSEHLPHWVQEGLAQYVSGEGDARVAEAAKHVHKSQAARLLYPLDAPYSAMGYPQYYLAIQYMFDKHSSNSISAFARDLIAGQSVPDAIQDAVDMPYDRFQQEVRDYSLKRFTDLAVPDFQAVFN